MVTHERLIKFPVPDWNRVIGSDIDSMAYCLCYQYDINLDDYGPYGFNTDAASKFISNTFKNLFFYNFNDGHDKAQLISAGTIKSEGVYLYGDANKINSLHLELKKYIQSVKKNEMRLKKSLQLEILPSKPLLLGLEKECEYRSDVIKEVINSGCGLLIYHHYMPVAGGSIILFDPYLESLLKDTALNYSVEYLEMASIDSLKAW